MRVHVVDYGTGNLHSVVNALRHVGAEPVIAEDGAALEDADRIVLPGVGAFADGMRGLSQRGHDDLLRRHAGRSRPLLGICLGAQFLMSSSDEFGHHRGLGLIPGRVVRIPAEGVKVPHVGWNRLEAGETGPWSTTPLCGAEIGSWAYFVHSFHMLPDDPLHVAATCRYGSHRITAAVALGPVCGMQFHPDKSGQAGLAMLASFLSI